MHQAARQVSRDPDRISFVRTLRVARRHVTDQAALSPSRLAQALARALSEIHERPLPTRRLHSNPRVIKRKMSNWAPKRTEHLGPPQPGIPTVALVGPTKTCPTKRKPT